MNGQAFSLPKITQGYYTDASGGAYERIRYLKIDTTRWLTEDRSAATNTFLTTLFRDGRYYH